MLHFVFQSIIFLLLRCISALYEKCDFFQPVELGLVYEVYSPNHPNKYGGNVTCRWAACAPPRTQLVVKCSSVDIPQTVCSPSCDLNSDRIEISYKGYVELNDAHYFCSAPLEFRTESNALVMAFIPVPNTPGGSFFCQVRAEPASLALPAPPPVPENKVQAPDAQPFPRYPGTSEWLPMPGYPPQSSLPKYETDSIAQFPQGYRPPPQWQYEQAMIRYQPYGLPYPFQPYGLPYEMLYPGYAYGRPPPYRPYPDIPPPYSYYPDSPPPYSYYPDSPPPYSPQPSGPQPSGPPPNNQQPSAPPPYSQQPSSPPPYSQQPPGPPPYSQQPPGPPQYSPQQPKPTPSSQPPPFSQQFNPEAPNQSGYNGYDTPTYEYQQFQSYQQQQPPSQQQSPQPFPSSPQSQYPSTQQSQYPSSQQSQYPSSQQQQFQPAQQSQFSSSQQTQYPSSQSSQFPPNTPFSYFQSASFQTTYQGFPPNQGGTPTGPPAPSQPNCHCGERKRARIVGGEDVEVEQIPYVGALKDIEHSVFCGCTIISESLVLTAAHCLSNRTINSVHVIVGTSDFKNPIYSKYSAMLPIIEAMIHPDFNYLTLANNIAMARVQHMTFSPGVQAVCLPISERFLFGEYFSHVEIAGYGESALSSPVSPQLKAVTLDVIDNKACSDVYPGIMDDNHVCTWSPGKDACTSDNGAGMCAQDIRSGLMVVDAIAISTIACGSKHPHIAFRVAPNINWIMTMAQENFCVI